MDRIWVRPSAIAIRGVADNTTFQKCNQKHPAPWSRVALPMAHGIATSAAGGCTKTPGAFSPAQLVVL